MSLTKDDLHQIKTIVDTSIKRVEHEVGTLAVATKQQFDQMGERFDRVEDRLGRIEEDLAVTKDLVKDHSFRIARLEHRLPSAG